MTPRPVRNNNPGDLEIGAPWRGLMPDEDMTEAQKHERFAVFQSPAWGFRALLKVLQSYQKLHGLDTVRKMVARFAPPSENDTQQYANFVASEMQIGADDKLDIFQPRTAFAAAKAFTKMETGGWEPFWHDADLKHGMSMAGYDYGEET